MDILEISAILLCLSAFFSYVNHRLIKLPTTIGIMLIAIVVSLSFVLLGFFHIGNVYGYALKVVKNIDFSETLMHGMLSFLLFAGALHINLDDLAMHRWIITILASAGVVITTFIVGGLSYFIFDSIGIEMPFIYSLVFGALIAPTDPVAVLGILKTAGVSKSLETKIAGESLFNDGVAVVVFLLILGIITGGQEVTTGSVIMLFVKEAIGGALLGFVAGWLVYLMLKSVDNYQVEVLLTLALVVGSYALADAIHISGPIAVVISGLLIGNRGRYLAMSDKTREHIDSFWELIDEILNAVLFLLIGFEVLVISVQLRPFAAGLIMIPVVLSARFVSVAIPVTIMKPFKKFSPNAIKILTWGGLRGGISVALALSLPTGAEREVILTITYIVVIFSILVQGLTIDKLVARSKFEEA